MTSFSPVIAGKPFEISKSSDELERADSTFWMRTILFRNHQNYNVLNRAIISRAVFSLFFVHLLFSISFGQNDWTAPLKKCWTFSNAESSRSRLASDNDKVFVPTSQGTIIALNQLNGSINWEADLGGNLETNLVAEEGELFVSAVFGDSSLLGTRTVLRKINPDTGIPYWQYASRNISHFLTGKSNTGRLVFAEGAGTVVRLDSLGKIVWKKTIMGQITTEVVEFENRLFFGTSNKTLVVADLFREDLAAQINLKTVPESIAVTNEGLVIVGDARGTVYGFPIESLRVRWRTTTGGGISEIEYYDGDVIISSKDNFVYRVSSANGKKIWKRKLAGRILGSVKIDRNHAVFLTSGAFTALILDLNDGTLVNKIEFEEAFVSGPVRIQNGFAVPTVSAIVAVTAGKCGE